MHSFPAFLKLQDRPVLIIGGGEEAARKARLFASAGARLVVIAERIDEAQFDIDGGSIRFFYRAPEPSDFVNAVVAVIADASDEDAARWAEEARGAGALVNVVDKPALCDFTTPSIIDRGEVVAAISTNGAAPVLGQRLRGQIEALAPQRLGDLAAFAKSFRGSVAATIPASARRGFWREIFNGPIAARFLAGDEVGAREAMIEAINRPQAAQAPTGVVHLVGAGPGDPELLTLKAHRLLQEADVILYDRLVGEPILSLARRDAARIFVGKAKARHAVPQEEIEALMIAHARQGKCVVRLKGGDPFVFGRGGEELEAVRAAGVDCHVTPGVTAATACAASAGMALTHRDYSQAVTFVTGHAKATDEARGGSAPDLDWAALAALKSTLVIYMGVTRAGEIADALISNGRAGATPVAIIENGSRANQRIIKGTLASLPQLIDAEGVRGPAILTVGEVAALADADIEAHVLSEKRLTA